MPDLPVPRFDTFYRHSELTRLLFDYADALPQLISVRSLGKSHEGRDIWVVAVTNSATGIDTALSSEQKSPPGQAMMLVIRTKFGVANHSALISRHSVCRSRCSTSCNTRLCSWVTLSSQKM